MAYREQLRTFGATGATVGVLTEPDQPAPRRPILVAANVGLNHRVGPNRMWVDLARRLADDGIAFFRFDFAGLGDSAPRTETLDDVQRATLDLAEAVDLLRGEGYNEIISISNCSGTDPAHRLMTAAHPFAGAVFIDGYTYETPGVRRRERTKYLDRKRWKRVAARRNLPDDVTELGAVDEIYLRDYPEQQAFIADMEAAVDACTELYFVYSGETQYRYPEQFVDWMLGSPAAHRIRVDYLPEANHTFRYREHRDDLARRVSEFVRSM